MVLGTGLEFFYQLYFPNQVQAPCFSFTVFPTGRRPMKPSNIIGIDFDFGSKEVAMFKISLYYNVCFQLYLLIVGIKLKYNSVGKMQLF